MKLFKIKSTIIILTLVLTFIVSPKEAHAMDARAKALGSMALYGTVGGALLGAASLAFGTSGRAVAQGASLGLYGGIIFGSYVVVSHSMRKSRYNSPRSAPANDNYYPEDANSPYRGSAPTGTGSDEDSWSFYNRMNLMNEYSSDFGLDMRSLDKLQHKKSGPDRPVFFMNLVNYQF